LACFADLTSTVPFLSLVSSFLPPLWPAEPFCFFFSIHQTQPGSFFLLGSRSFHPPCDPMFLLLISPNLCEGYSPPFDETRNVSPPFKTGVSPPLSLCSSTTNNPPPTPPPPFPPSPSYHPLNPVPALSPFLPSMPAGTSLPPRPLWPGIRYFFFFLQRVRLSSFWFAGTPFRVFLSAGPPAGTL